MARNDQGKIFHDCNDSDRQPVSEHKTTVKGKSATWSLAPKLFQALCLPGEKMTIQVIPGCR
jgi:hypothetical protein